MYAPGGRITGTSNTPVTTADVADITTLYYTPHLHNKIMLWDGVKWVTISFTETSIALGTRTAAIGHDVFGYLGGGTLSLEILAWSSATARATAITLQNGRYCKDGDKTRLWLGSFYTSSTTQTQDTKAKRFLYNAYNRTPREMRSPGGASHTMIASQADREWNAGTSAPRAEFFQGIEGDALIGSSASRIQTAGAADNIRFAVALDTTNTNIGGVGQFFGFAGTGHARPVLTKGVVFPTIGYHFLTIREQNFHTSTSGTMDSATTFGILNA